MAIVNFNKFTTHESDILEGAARLTHAHHGLQHQVDYVPTMPELYFDFKKMDGPEIAGPVATLFRRPDDTDIDAYTLACEGICYAGGSFLGDLTPVLREVDFTSTNTVLNDMMASSLWYFIQGDPNMGFAFLQTAHKFIAMYAQMAIDVPLLQQNETGGIVPYGL